MTVLAWLAPAFRATRVSPISAVREGARAAARPPRPVHPVHRGALVSVALLLLGYSMFADELGTAGRLLSIAVGVLLLFVGVAMLSPKLVRPVADALAPAVRGVLLGLSVLFYPVLLAAWLLSTGVLARGVSGGRRALHILAGPAVPILYGVVLLAVLMSSTDCRRGCS